MSRWRRAALAAAIIAVAAACGPTPATEIDDSTTVATAPTTRTPRIVDDSGRPDITFDPCLDLPDDVMTAAGYDAAHKEFADMPMGSYTFLACAYRGTELVRGTRKFSLNVLSGNIKLEEELAKNGEISTAITVNGRRGLREIGPNGRNECTYALQTNFGIVLVNRLYHSDGSALPKEEWCAGMEELTAILEQYIAN